MLSRAAVLVSLAQVGAASNTDTVGQGLQENGANPIRRVVTLLEKMAKKVESEGDEEAALYKKFKCYCSTGGASLQASIDAANTKSPQLASDIEEAESEKKQLQLDLKAHQADREQAKAAIESATSQREKEHKVYADAAAEHNANINAMKAAIPAIEKGMAGGFLQNRAGASTGAAAVKRALAASSSITEYDREVVTAFIEGTRATDQDGADYTPKSGEIVGILKSLQEDFEKSLAEVEDTEAQAVKAFEQLTAAKQKQVNTLTESIEKKTKRVGDLGVEIVTMKNDLSDTEAALIEDQKLAANLEEDCKTKAAEWDERQKTRAEELVAIHDTIKILNDDDALDLFKKTLPSASLIQVETRTEQLRKKALSLIQGAHAPASRAGLDFLAVALSGRKVDFSKVIKMIEDMVALLKQEQVDDDNKLEYCKIQLDTNEDKIKDLGKKIEDLQASIADSEETISAMVQDTKTLQEGVKALDKSVEEAAEQRKKEHEEFVELMSGNNAAKELLGFAKNRLNKFYSPNLYKPPPKRQLTEEEQIVVNQGGTLSPTPAPGGIAGTGVDMPGASLLQTGSRKEDPGAPPATWDAYSKKSGDSNGVISMIDLLIRDLDKEMTEAETDEKHAQKAYETMLSDAASKRAADVKAISANEASKANAEGVKEAATEDERLSQSELKANKMYGMQLHQECDWLMQYYDLRKTARAEETDNLKQAKAVLAGADFSLVQTAKTAPVKKH